MVTLDRLLAQRRQKDRPVGRRIPAREERQRFKRATRREASQRARRFDTQGPQPTGATAEEIAQAFLDATGGGGGGGGGGRSQVDEIALIREQSRLADEEAARARADDAAQREIDRVTAAKIEQDRVNEERRQQAASIQSERQRIYTDLLGRDPVRAILFAMGIGPEADIFSTQLKSLGATQTPLAGVGQGRLQTETALSGLLGRSVQLGAGGVTGLGGAEQAARAFQSGGADIQKLLTSAFGVGGTKGAGISAEELIQRIGAVTPTGVLQR